MFFASIQDPRSPRISSDKQIKLSTSGASAKQSGLHSPLHAGVQTRQTPKVGTFEFLEVASHLKVLCASSVQTGKAPTHFNNVLLGEDEDPHSPCGLWIGVFSNEGVHVNINHPEEATK